MEIIDVNHNVDVAVVGQKSMRGANGGRDFKVYRRVFRASWETGRYVFNTSIRGDKNDEFSADIYILPLRFH